MAIALLGSCIEGLLRRAFADGSDADLVVGGPSFQHSALGLRNMILFEGSRMLRKLLRATPTGVFKGWLAYI